MDQQDAEGEPVLHCALFLELYPDGEFRVERLEPEGQGIPADEVIRGLRDYADKLWQAEEAKA